jgi:DUF2075 family protein
MRLYAGMSQNFIHDTVHNQIAGKLSEAFIRHFRHKPSPSEVNSWRNSLRAVSDVFQLAHLDDHGVILEFQLPLTSRRLDCLVCGKDGHARDSAVIIELKQWDKCGRAAGDNLVSTWVGGSERDILHPSAQVGQYHQYLADNHTAFHEGPAPVQLKSCAYLHNYFSEEDDPLLDDSFSALLRQFPTFTADDVLLLKDFLISGLSGGSGQPVLRKIEESKYRPSKKLMEHVSSVIKGKKEYILLDEQYVVYNKVLACSKEGFHDRRKTAIIVKGGPGTGKSVIAINLMSDLLTRGLNAHYATGSKAFTETLRKIIGLRGSSQFKYFNSYAQAQSNEIDVLVCDEAHRIRKTSNSRYTPREQQSNKPQIQEILDAAKVSVFFIDDKQVVRPDEIGSSGFIREQAEKNGCRIFEYELEAQFRCAGSDGFVNWINNTLDIERTANVIWEGDESFEFRVFPSPQALDEAIREKAKMGHTARMTAGFCWSWSDPKSDGSLVEDVQIEGYRKPWNAKPEARRLAAGIPKATLWAYDPNGINQIGCIYTAQGFEFDYMGVIVGTDFTYNLDDQKWDAHLDKSFDVPVKRAKGKFVELVKNTYRVLFSRGMKGCYVYFVDKDTERFFKSRMDLSAMQKRFSTTPEITSPREEVTVLPFRRLPPNEVKPYVNCVPLYDLKVAAGRFSDEQQVTEVMQGTRGENIEAIDWIELPGAFRPRRGLFVAQIVGESMNRRIPNGSWCLFRLDPVGSRQGKIVLAQHRDIADADTGGHYTVKRYESTKKVLPDGTWRHESITLRPDTTSPGYDPFIFNESQGADVRIIAELVAVLG